MRVAWHIWEVNPILRSKEELISIYMLGFGATGH